MKKNSGIACDIPMALREADEILTRYGRWAFDRSTDRRCGSAEGAYRAPQDDEDRKPRESLMATHDALAAQRALQRVPDRERIVLNVLYIPKRLPPEAQLRILRIPPALSRERHLNGLRMFANLYSLALNCGHLTQSQRLGQPVG